MSLHPARSARPAAQRILAGGMAPLLVFIAACLLYSINLGRAPHPDELYHVLAARGLLEHGEPRIAEGLYTRTLAYTWLIAGMFSLLGESLSAARLPSLLAMAALGAGLFVWLRREAGSGVAVLATGLLVLSPYALETAQFARFYALQTLAFFLGCWAAYAVLGPRATGVGRRGGLALAACLLLAAATYLQPTTLLGVAGLGLWLVLVLSVPWLAAPAVPRRHKHLLVLLALLLAAAGVVLLLATGLGDRLWAMYRNVPAFNRSQVDEFWYYHVFNVLYYPSLWPVVGFLCLAALAAWPRPALFAMTIFATGFLLNSFAGPKNLRYAVYAQPFLFALLGLGLGAVWPWARDCLAACRERLEGRLAALHITGGWLPGALVWGSLAFAILANAAFLRTATLLAGITVPPGLPPILWAEARPLVETRLAATDVVVTMAELETLYFWDRYDLLFSPSRLGELAEQHQFAPDFRTGRPVISTVDALERVFACSGSGMFVTNTHRWPKPDLVDQATVEFIEREMTRLDLPRSTQLIVFTWEHSPLDPASPACAWREGRRRDGR